MKKIIGFLLIGILPVVIFANWVYENQEKDATEKEKMARFNGAMLIGSLFWIGLTLIMF